MTAATIEHRPCHGPQTPTWYDCPNCHAPLTQMQAFAVGFDRGFDRGFESVIEGTFWFFEGIYFRWPSAIGRGTVRLARKVVRRA